MIRTRTIVVIAASYCGLVTTAACDRTPQEAHTDAVEAQKQAGQDIRSNNQQAEKTVAEAQRDVNKANTEATQKAAEVTADADKKIAGAHEQAREDNAEAQAKANVKIREANVDVVADKSEVRVWGQKKIDGLNTMIDDVRVKAQKSDKPKPNFETGLLAVQTKRDELANELASIDAQGAQKTAAFKTRMNGEVDQLKARVEKLGSAY